MIAKFARMVAPLAIVFFAVSAQAGMQVGADSSGSLAQPDTAGARRDYDRTQQQMGRIPDMDETEAAENVKLPQRFAKKDKTKDGDTGAAASSDTQDNSTAAATDGSSQADKDAKKAERKAKKAEKKKNKKKSKTKDDNKDANTQG